MLKNEEGGIACITADGIRVRPPGAGDNVSELLEILGIDRRHFLGYRLECVGAVIARGEERRHFFLRCLIRGAHRNKLFFELRRVIGRGCRIRNGRGECDPGEHAEQS